MKTILSNSRVAIVGLGQMGSSLGLALRGQGCQAVCGVALSQDEIDAGIEQGVIDYGSVEADDVLPNTDITFLCVPLTASIEFVKQNLEHFRFGSVVTDVGSVKGGIVSALRPMLHEKGVYFVGSHPMAGSEKTGMANASVDLYHNTICFLTPTEDDDEEVLQILHDFWAAAGACVIELDCARHDLACAFVSHSPHMTAAAVVNSVLGLGDVEAKQLACAGGFRDHTRIASSDVHMWVDVCKHNQEAVLEAMTSFEDELTRLRRAIEQQDWDSLSAGLAQAQGLRNDWLRDFGMSRGYDKFEEITEE